MLKNKFLTKCYPIILLIVFALFVVRVSYAQSDRQRLEKGKELISQGEYEDAIKELSRAIDTNPELAEAYWLRGTIYSRKGEYEKAIKEYSRVIELNERSPNALYNRATAYFFLKKYEKAWDDVCTMEDLGYEVSEGLLQPLEKASGRKR